MEARKSLPIALVLLTVLVVWLAAVSSHEAPLPAAPSVGETIAKAVPIIETTGSAARSEIALPEATTVAKRAVEVRVLRADTRAPLPGVEVWVCANGCWDAADLESVCRDRGLAVRAGADGVVHVEAAGLASVFARQDGLVGALSLQKPGAHDLLMHPDRAIAVRVVDVHGGAAAGVSLSAAVPGDSSWYGLGATGDDGVRAWPDFGLFLARRAEVARGLRVRASLPGHEGIVIETDGLPANGATLDLRLPATGQITVRVHDPAGRPVLGKWPLQLCAVTVFANGERGRSCSSGINVVNGVTVIERVPLDGLFEVTMQPSSAVTELIASGVFRGPSAVQPAVDVVMGLPAEAALLRGRAIDGDGRVVRSGRMVLRFIDRADNFQLWAQQLDADGGFLLVVPEASVARPMGSAVAQLFPDPTDHRRWISADLRPWVPFDPGITEVGDLVFDDFPVLVAGRVVPAPGAACKDFHLLVEHRAPGTDWRGLDVQLRIDGGDFAALMPPMPGDYRLRVVPNARCHVPPEPIPFTPGQRDLEVVLDRGHTLELRVRLGACSERPRGDSFLRTELRATAGEATTRIATDRDGVPSSGGWRPGAGREVVRYWNGLVEGTYELCILAGQRLLRVVPGIRVPTTSGGVPEIELDLSTEIQEVTLHVRTPVGEPTTFEVWPLAADGSCAGGITHAGGTAPVRKLVARGGSDLWILALGYAPVRLRNVDGDRMVLLEPCRATVRVHLHGVGPLPEDVVLRLTATADPVVPPAWDAPPRATDSRALSPWTNFDRTWPASVAALVGPGGTAELTVLRPGPQRLTLEVCSGGGARVPIDTEMPIVDVTAGSSCSVRITVPGAALDRALQALRDR